jgi:hypothetical protein
LTGLESALWQQTIFDFICKTDKSKPVKQEVNGTMILPPLVFPGLTYKKAFVDLCQKSFMKWSPGADQIKIFEVKNALL